MRRSRRTSLLWGFVLLLIALAVMAYALGLIPPTLADVLVRAWPALLVLAGLAGLLRNRVPLSGLIAIVLTVAITAGIAAYAFSSRAGEFRTDNEQAVTQPVPPETALLRVRLNTLTTDVEVLRAVEPDAGISARFVGSIESDLVTEYVEAEDSSATFTLRETRPASIPRLDAIGRGMLRVEVPPNVPLDLELIGTDGDVTLNMGDTRLEHLNLDLARGDALVTLPEYAPVFTPASETLGTLAVRDGAITVVIPETVAGRLDIERGGSGLEPEYDPNTYNFLFNRLLEARAIEIADIIVQYAIIAPRGRVRLEVVEAAPASA